MVASWLRTKIVYLSNHPSTNQARCIPERFCNQPTDNAITELFSRNTEISY